VRYYHLFHLKKRSEMTNFRSIPIIGWSVFVIIFLSVPGTQVFAGTYYASPSGSNSNPGTIDHPWQTFKYAQGQLSAGDTLYLRGGTYYESSSSVTINRQGDELSPITIQSYPGEQAVISGALTYFMTAPNSEWILVDPAINLYRTSRTVSVSNASFYPGAWLINDDIQIIHYGNNTGNIGNTADMDSTNYKPNGMDPFYNGPGMMSRGSYLYIRLEPNPYDLNDISGNPISPVPSVYNPNLMPIAVWTHNTLIELRSPAAYIRFKDLTFAHAGYVIDSYNGTSNIELDHCKFKYGSYCVLVRDATPSSHDWYVHDCEFTNGVPDWIHWLDVKAKDPPDPYANPKEAYPEFQSDAFSSGAMVNFLIERNVFRNVFDGMTIPSGSRNVTIRSNIFKYSTDDAMNLLKDINNVEVAYNMFWHVASGISCLSGEGEQTGPVYIHHNVIDNSHYRRGGRPNCADTRWRPYPWATLDPWGSHDDTDLAAWWRVYNNTIITRLDGPYNSEPAGPRIAWGNPEKYVYNNIFLSRDARIIFDGSLSGHNETFATGSHWDGDVVYQMATSGSYPLLNKWGNSSSYTTLAAFRAANPTSDWEVNGLEIDSQFDFTDIDDPNFDPNTIWERYRPANPQVFTPGASYAGLDWPDTEYVSYRGAIPPEGANLDQTGYVDFADFAVFAEQWFEDDCFPPLWCEGADINKSGNVDTFDLYEFGEAWLSF
jgi:hypothetical protein